MRSTCAPDLWDWAAKPINIHRNQSFVTFLSKTPSKFWRMCAHLCHAAGGELDPAPFSEWPTLEGEPETSTARYQWRSVSIACIRLGGWFPADCGPRGSGCRCILALAAASPPHIVSELPDPLAVELKVEYPNLILGGVDSRESSEEIFFQIQSSPPS